MKKGFTLIELLAVILILGIIALIAIPTVNNILKESRRGAFQSTLTNLEKAIEEKCTTEQIKNQEITTMYTIEDGVISPSLDIKGSLPDGVIYVSKTCEVSYTLSDNNFTGTKEVGGEVVIGDKGNTETIYRESILNGTDPVLNDNLIPVIIANDGTVTKADINSKWYSYAEKKWANAVILTPTGKVEEDGTILETSIESYFVWIPRYKYKLFDMGNYDNFINSQPTVIGSDRKIIDIVFENKNTEVSVGNHVGEYHSHPAFQAFNVNGIWVGKFETTGSTSNLTIKPDKQSLRNISVKQIFEISYNYKRENDSHMMKNTEWGAVTYLALSKYGKNDIINLNNNWSYKTGYSSVVPYDDENYVDSASGDLSLTQPYNTNIGYKASTTGNITGIYDMSGGSKEFMASYMESYLGDSEFEEDPVTIYGSKYFDIYSSISSKNSYNYRILGDATGEIGPFYNFSGVYKNNWYLNSNSGFLNSSNPWFYRGGYCFVGKTSGILTFNANPGNASVHMTFRIVLAK